MALGVPTFDGTDLCTTSQRQVPGPIRTRIHIENIPGVDGDYAQPQGRGGRDIPVVGVLHTTAAGTRAAATVLAYAELRVKEKLADGATIGDYVDPAGTTITGCVLMSYAPAGAVEIVPVPTAATFRGIIPVRIVIHELNP